MWMAGGTAVKWAAALVPSLAANWAEKTVCCLASLSADHWAEWMAAESAANLDRGKAERSALRSAAAMELHLVDSTVSRWAGRRALMTAAHLVYRLAAEMERLMAVDSVEHWERWLVGRKESWLAAGKVAQRAAG